MRTLRLQEAVRGRSESRALVFACVHPAADPACVVGEQTGQCCLSPLCRSSQYSMVAGAGRENGMETPMHENPEWEKARQALASISKAGAAGSSAKASSNGPVASAQVRVHRGPGYPECGWEYPPMVSSGVTWAGCSL